MTTVTHRALGSALAVGMSLGALAGVSSTTTVAQAAPVDQPNIVIVITDDQRRGLLSTMPTVRQQLRNKGTSFVGVIPTSTCCPSRSGLLTGNYAHTTGVWSNLLRTGGWPTFNASGYEDRTLATTLQGAGYRTGLVGKYMNHWNKAPEGFVPPGWDVFRAIYQPTGQGAGAYYNYELRGTEPTEAFADRPRDYSTDVIASRSVDFVATTPADQPLFLVVSTTGPHAKFVPAPRHASAKIPKSSYWNPAMNEKDMSDKPEFMRGRPKLDEDWIKRAHTRTLRTLMSVDEAVDDVITALGTRMKDTLFVFMSDNGYLWGEHRLTDKNQPHRWATEVPMIVRWDGRLGAGVRSGMAANLDVTATALDAAGIPGALDMAGRSLLEGPRRSLVMEAAKSKVRPSYCGIRTKRWLFVEYNNGKGRELYDYATDPHELESLARKPKYRGKMLRLRDRAQEECSPAPPNFSW